MKYALIFEGVVLEVKEMSEAEVQLAARHYQAVIDVSTMDPAPSAGWSFNGVTMLPPPEAILPKKITRLAFRNRLSSVEKANIYAIAAQNSSLGFAIRSYLDDLSAATFIDLARPDTIASVNQLVALGIFTSQRAQEILNNPILEIERFKE